jgi:hypothetical protein
MFEVILSHAVIHPQLAVNPPTATQENEAAVSLGQTCAVFHIGENAAMSRDTA